MPHRIFRGDACFAYFNKIWGIPRTTVQKSYHDLKQPSHLLLPIIEQS